MHQIAKALWLLWAAAAAAGCGDVPSRIGEPCQTDAHCGTADGQALVCDHTIPGGSCTLRGCDPGLPESCPAGALCVAEQDAPAAGGSCRRACDDVLDCRAVIACGPEPDCDPTAEQCGEHCANAMRCALLDPAGDEDGPRICSFSPP